MAEQLSQSLAQRQPSQMTEDIADALSAVSKGADAARSLSTGPPAWLQEIDSTFGTGLTQAFGMGAQSIATPFAETAAGAAGTPLSMAPGSTAAAPGVGVGSASAGGVGSTAGAAPFMLNPATMWAGPVAAGLVSGIMARMKPDEPGATLSVGDDGMLTAQTSARDAPRDEWQSNVDDFTNFVNERIQSGDMSLPQDMQPISLAGNIAATPTKFATGRSGYGVGGDDRWGATTFEAPVTSEGFASLVGSGPQDISSGMADTLARRRSSSSAQPMMQRVSGKIGEPERHVDLNAK